MAQGTTLASIQQPGKRRLPCHRTSASGFPQRARDTLVIPPPLDENGGERGPQERFQARLVCAGEIDREIGG